MAHTHASDGVELAQLAEEQAALRRVATLVAHDVAPDELFRAVGGEVGRLLGTDLAGISRYDPDDVVTHFSAWSAAGEAPEMAGRVSRDSPGLSKTIRDTGRPARVDEWHEIPAVLTGADRALKVRSAVGSPIVVENRVWGKLVVASTQSQLAPDTESRLMAFTELVGTAIANADARGQVQRLAEEQAALRRVATLVAQDVPARELFGAVVGEVGVLLGADLGGMIRYEEDGTVTAVAAWAAVGEHPPMPERWQIEPGDPAWLILENRAATRVEDWTSVPGPFAEAVRNNFGVSSSVGCPIVVEGRLWGALAIHSKQSRPLPPDTESRIAQFTDLVGTAIANAESRERADRLGDEQAALRRVATLVAKEASPAEVFATVAEEAANVLGEVECALLRDEGDGTASTVAAWGAGMSARFPLDTRVPADGDGVLAFVLREGRPRRIDDYSAVGEPTAEGAREHGIGSAVGHPIVVGGGSWGAIVAARFGAEPCPPETESHVARFADLVATAIANAGSRAEVERLAAEQAALRRVATLVAQDAPADELFDAVAHEAAELLACERAAIVRFAGDGTATVVGGHDALRTPGIPFTPDPDYVIAAVQATGRAARFDTDDPSAAAMPEPVRAEGICSGLASPIVVDGALWGTITVASLGRSLPSHAEHRLAEFTQLVATAISNAQSREARQVLADEQAALRRVATLVAKEGPPAQVLVKVAEQVASLLGDADCVLYRDEGDGTATVVGVAGAALSAAVRLGSRWPADGTGVIATVLREGRPHRIDDYDEKATGTMATVGRDRIGVRTAVGCPIVVGGRIWGAIAAGRYRSEAFPAETEAALTRFADLAATAVANADARAEVERLAEEQAALRRVATLVAQGASPQDLFDAVAEAVGRLLSIGSATMGRFEPDGSVTTVASWSTTAAAFPTGRRWPTEGTNIAWMVLQTGQAARRDDFAAATDPIGVTARESGVKSAVGCPIVVEGHIWGLITVGSTEGPMPPGAEARLASFTELVATAIANAESSAELAASRARIATAADEERRRVVRDLHDGAQQRLVHTVITLKLAQQALAKGAENGPLLVQEAIGNAEQATAEVRELAHGILPAVLTHGGLRAGIAALRSRTPVPVEIDVSVDRLPAPIEATAYFVVAEALTNVAKHSSAGHAEVVARVEGGMLCVEVRDDGVGGASMDGTGLVGLADRLAVLDGRLEVDSPPGAGTRLTAAIPLARSDHAAGA